MNLVSSCRSLNCPLALGAWLLGMSSDSRHHHRQWAPVGYSLADANHALRIDHALTFDRSDTADGPSRPASDKDNSVRSTKWSFNGLPR
jgi:hypothetical protein